jgi:biotin carboxyl carrier protein
MKKFNITVNGKTYEVDVEEVGGIPAAPTAPRAASAAPQAAPKAAPKAAAKPTVSGSGSKVSAPMPGTVFKLNCQEGDTVSAGDVVMVLEAMKMENEITSPVDGTVAQILVKTGQAVNGGDVMIVIE